MGSGARLATYESRWKSMNNHLHNPRPPHSCFECALLEFAIVLPVEGSDSVDGTGVGRQSHRIRRGGLGVLPMYVLELGLGMVVAQHARDLVRF